MLHTIESPHKSLKPPLRGRQGSELRLGAQALSVRSPSEPHDPRGVAALNPANPAGREVKNKTVKLQNDAPNNGCLEPKGKSRPWPLSPSIPLVPPLPRLPSLLPAPPSPDPLRPSRLPSSPLILTCCVLPSPFRGFSLCTSFSSPKASRGFGNGVGRAQGEPPEGGRRAPQRERQRRRRGKGEKAPEEEREGKGRRARESCAEIRRGRGGSEGLCGSRSNPTNHLPG